jgi:hypothetical protein
VVKAAPAPVAADGGVTFTPSKGLTISFNGDFTDFKRAAAQVLDYKH